MKIFVLYIGKARDRNANGMAQEYLKRTERYARCEMREINPDRYDPWERHPSALKVRLDPSGKATDTAGFVALVDKAEQRGQDLVFLIGGHDGLPPGWRERPGQSLSLSAMTFPHELARAMLAEQIYRAFTTLRGHPYPR